MDERFGTWLRPAMADIDEDRLTKRWAAVEKLSTELEHREIRDLIRFSAQVGTVDESTISKVRQSFWEQDKTFEMTNNDVELRLLASSTVIRILRNESSDQLDHALAVACLDFCGAHSGFELPALVEEANRALNSMSQAMRPANTLAKPQKRAVSAAAAMKQFKERIDAGQTQVMFPDLEAVLTDYGKAFNQLSADNSKLHTAIELEKEEIDILWWLVAAHSNDLEKPLSEFPKAPAAVLAGKELADLVAHRPGPIGAANILGRMLANGSGKKQKISLQNLVSKLPLEWRKKIATSVTEYSNQICPLLSAIAASVELDDEDAWIKVFARKFPHSTSAPLSPEILAFQMYREWMMVLEIETWE